MSHIAAAGLIMLESFQASRRNLRLGMSTLAMWSCFAVVGSVGVFFENPESLPMGRRLVLGVLPLAMFSPFIALSLWLILSHYRWRLLVGSRSLALCGVFRLRRVSFRDVTRVKWLPRFELRLWTSCRRISIPVSEAATHQQERLVRLLQERIGPDAQAGWRDIHWELLRREADPEHHKKLLRQSFRLSAIGPVVGLILGTACHVLWGYHPEIGLKGNLILFGFLAGCATSILTSLMMTWTCWLMKPDEPGARE